MRALTGAAARRLLAGMLLITTSACGGAPVGSGAFAGMPLPELPKLPRIQARDALDLLAGHTFACSGPTPDPAVPMVRHVCEAVGSDADTTATSRAVIEGSPDGSDVFTIIGEVAIRSGRPDDDFIVGLCGNILGSLPFAEPAIPDLIPWVAEHVGTPTSGQWGTVMVDLAGPPHLRRCVIAGLSDAAIGR